MTSQDGIVLTQLQATGGILAIFPGIVAGNAGLAAGRMLRTFQDDLDAIALLFRHGAKIGQIVFLQTNALRLYSINALPLGDAAGSGFIGIVSDAGRLGLCRRKRVV